MRRTKIDGRRLIPMIRGLFFLGLAALAAAGCSSPADPPPQDAATIEVEGLIFRRVSPARCGRPGPDFFLLETEVTNAQYARCLRATGRKKDDEALAARKEEERKSGGAHSTTDAEIGIRNPALLWKNNRPPAGLEDHPVSLISVVEAAAFCEWLTASRPGLGTFRFPTVDEWVTAAYGASRSYPWGETWEDSRVHLHAAGTESVRARPDGRSPDGIYGLLGNVDEFVVHPSEVRNAHFLGVGARWMGGSFADTVAVKPRQDYFGYWHNEEGRSQEFGFRVLLDPTDREHRFKHQTPYDRERR